MLSEDWEVRLEENRRLLEEDIFDIDDTKYRSWYIVVTFYIVVHLFSKDLCENKSGVYPNSHTERSVEIRRFYSDEMFAKYRSLYKLGQKARYEYEEMTFTQCKRAKDILEFIEMNL